VIDETVDWLRAEYESIFKDGLGAMKAHRGKVHKYLGMGLDFSHKGKCIVTMHDYLDGILKAFDAAMEKHEHRFQPVTRQRYETPAPTNLFIVNEDCEKLPDDVTKRARPDTCLLIAFLTTRVRAPDRDDWEKLCHLEVSKERSCKGSCIGC
jgi:hypothetical protein